MSAPVQDAVAVEVWADATAGNTSASSARAPAVRTLRPTDLRGEGRTTMRPFLGFVARGALCGPRVGDLERTTLPAPKNLREQVVRFPRRAVLKRARTVRGAPAAARRANGGSTCAVRPRRPAGTP